MAKMVNIRMVQGRKLEKEKGDSYQDVYRAIYGQR